MAYLENLNRRQLVDTRSQDFHPKLAHNCFPWKAEFQCIKFPPQGTFQISEDSSYSILSGLQLKCLSRLLC